MSPDKMFCIISRKTRKKLAKIICALLFHTKATSFEIYRGMMVVSDMFFLQLSMHVDDLG